MHSIKVCHVITRLILGGAQENTLLTCEGLSSRHGYDVLLVSGPATGPEGELIGHAHRKGIPLFLIDELHREIRPWRDFMALVKLWRLFLKRRPKIVHTHSSKAGILGRLSAWLAGIPIIVHTIHGLPFHEHESPIRNALYASLERLAARISSKIICVGEVMKRKAVEARLASADRFRVIYSGMETEPFLAPRMDSTATRLKLRIPENALLLGMLSRLAPLKGHEELLEAAARLQARHDRIHVLMIGDGELRTLLEKKASFLKVPCTFTGLVEPDRIPELLGATDIVVHTSYREGLPRAIPQALLAGKPVVAFDCDGAREVVLDGITGRLVPPRAVDQLVQALCDLLCRPDLGRSLGEEGRRRFLDQFRADRMVERIDDLYRSLLKKY